MADDPAFLFYTGDFSTGTQFFSDEQVGKYLRLLMAQHQHGHLSEKQMMQICKTYDTEVFEKFRKDSAGKFYQSRLEFEIMKRKGFCESRSKNKAGKFKVIKNKTVKKNKSKSYDNHMEDENENENRDKNKIENEKIEYPFSPLFLPHWKRWLEYKKDQHKFIYKKFTSELAGIKTLFELSKGMEDAAEKIINQSIGNGWKGFFELKINANGFTTKQQNITAANADQLNRVVKGTL